MNSTIKRCNQQTSGCKHMVFLTTVLFLTTIFITLTDAQQEEPKSETDSTKIATKRAAFLPSRGRRFWSIFDWDDSSEKRMSRFLPMRGRKAGFLPMRGKKYTSEPMDDYVDLYPLVYGTSSDDSPAEALDKRASFMPSRGKKAFHAMRGKKSAQELLQQFDSTSSDNNNEIRDKKSRNFFGMRG